MAAIQGSFDGAAVRPLEPLAIIREDFAEPENPAHARKRGMRGVLAQYANPALAKEERGAWERAAAEKHGLA